MTVRVVERPTIRRRYRRWILPGGPLCDDLRVGEYTVAVGAGTLRSRAAHAVSFPHAWTEVGVTVEAAFTGAHLLHLAAAGCVLNDIYREAEALGLEIHGVCVSARGEYETASWRSTGIDYTVRVECDAPQGEVEALIQRVDTVAEIPRAIRAGAPVRRRQK